jgi:uncharacterized membrane protein YkoI
MQIKKVHFFIKKLIGFISNKLVILLVVLSISTAYSSAEESVAKIRKLVESGEILPLESIIASAKIMKPGQILDIELERKKGFYVYEIEILDNQDRVWELKFNARTGKLIKLERDD